GNGTEFFIVLVNSLIDHIKTFIIYFLFVNAHFFCVFLKINQQLIHTRTISKSLIIAVGQGFLKPKWQKAYQKAECCFEFFLLPGSSSFYLRRKNWKCKTGTLRY